MEPTEPPSIRFQKLPGRVWSWRRGLSVAATIVLLAWVVVGWRVFVNPKVDRASPADPADPADAIVVLGGEPRAASYGVQLFAAGDARTLVLSDPYEKSEPSALAGLCPPPPGRRVTCFAPDPSTTRGEAQQIGRLAERNHWDDVIVVAPRYHISRARMIVKRCYAGRLRMVGLSPVPAWAWPYQYVYQTFAYAKAGILRGC